MTKPSPLGWPFVLYYNGKFKNGFEQIGMAVSSDMKNWTRYGTNPVVANGEEKRNGMSGDPQIVKIGDVWVMFYFGAGWGPRAFDTFASSYDLVHWTKWTGPNLIEPSEPYDKTYAHKPWVLKWNGVVYHFYCAVGTEGTRAGAGHLERFKNFKFAMTMKIKHFLWAWQSGTGVPPVRFRKNDSCNKRNTRAGRPIPTTTALAAC